MSLMSDMSEPEVFRTPGIRYDHSERKTILNNLTPVLQNRNSLSALVSMDRLKFKEDGKFTTKQQINLRASQIAKTIIEGDKDDWTGGEESSSGNKRASQDISN